MTTQQETPSSIRLKRQATIKTVVTPGFRERAKKEFGQEIRLIDTQLDNLDQTYTQTLRQLEQLAQAGKPVGPQMDQLNQEAQAKMNQLKALKAEVSRQLGNIDTVGDGAEVITGMLESYVDVQIGDNIYTKVRNTEIIVKDGIVKTIRELGKTPE